MFTIYIKTHNGYKKEYSIVDRDLAVFYFKAFMQAVDIANIIMIDGLTGEVLYEWNGKNFTVFNSQVIDVNLI